MSPDIEDLLRSELRGAAGGAPQHLGVDDQDVLTRGRRFVVRRRIITVAGVAAATLAIAGTIGVLAPQNNDDALPAIPTPTVTPTKDPTPTITTTSSPSVSVTSSATTSPTATPSSTPSTRTSSTGKPSRTNAPSSTPSATPSSTPTPSRRTTPWSNSVTVAGQSFRARFIESVPEPSSRPNWDVQITDDGVLARDFLAFYPAAGTWGVSTADARFVFSFDMKIVDLVAIDGVPVTDEQIGYLLIPEPLRVGSSETTDEGEAVSIVRTTGATIRRSPHEFGPSGWTVRFANGVERTY